MRKRTRVHRWIGLLMGGACLAMGTPVGSQPQPPQAAQLPAQQPAQQPVQQPVQRATPQATPQAAQPDTPLFEGPNLRIGVTAVEIDAVVSGKDGRPITDLRPEEFEIRQDGRKQTVISAHYIRSHRRLPAGPRRRPAPKISPPRRRPACRGRTMSGTRWRSSSTI